MIRIDRKKCGGCVDLCPRAAIGFVKDRALITPSLCLECKTCMNVCPLKAPGVV